MSIGPRLTDSPHLIPSCFQHCSLLGLSSSLSPWHPLGRGHRTHISPAPDKEQAINEKMAKYAVIDIWTEIGARGPWHWRVHTQLLSHVERHRPGAFPHCMWMAHADLGPRQIVPPSRPALTHSPPTSLPQNQVDSRQAYE